MDKTDLHRRAKELTKVKKFYPANACKRIGSMVEGRLTGVFPGSVTGRSIPAFTCEESCGETVINDQAA